MTKNNTHLLELVKIVNNKKAEQQNFWIKRISTIMMMKSQVVKAENKSNSKVFTDSINNVSKAKTKNKSKP